MAGLANTKQKSLPSYDEARAISNEANDITLPEPAGPTLTQAGRDIKAFFSEDQPVQPATSRTSTPPPPEAQPQKPVAKPAERPRILAEAVPDDKAKSVLHGMNSLIKDFGMKPHEAAAVMGNLAHESDWFRNLEEDKSKYTKGKGGYGWAQWTDNEWEPRRTNFLKYAKQNKLKPTSDQANYGFLREDFKANPRYLNSLKGSPDVLVATEKFMNSYERPKAEVAHLDKRQARAQGALELYHRVKSRTQKLAMN